MDLVQVDDVHPQPSQAGLGLATDKVRLEAAADLPVLVPDHRAFREHKGLPRHPADCPADQLFGVPEPVDRCSVDPVHAEIDGGLDGLDGLTLVLRPLGEFPFLPPMAQLPKPIGVISRSVSPSRLVSMNSPRYSPVILASGPFALRGRPATSIATRP